MVKVSKSKKKSEQAMVDAAVEAAVEAAIDSQESEEERDDSVNEEESDDDSESEEDATAIFKGVSVPEEEDAEDGSGDESMDKGNKAKNAAPSQPTLVNGVEQCTFDLRNMLAVNSHQIAPGSLYATKKGSKSADDNITIPLDKGHGLEVDEEFLLSKASAGCTQLVHALWQLPTERSDAGPLVHLPSYDEIKIPRALPPPPPKDETKWEKFAKAKGIPLNKEKRSRKVWDESTGTWMFRHGYEKANAKGKEWPIVEVGANDNPFDDPWEKLRDSKRARTEKNLESNMKNQERIGSLAKGTTNRVIKSREQSRKSGKEGGNADRDNINVLPTGVPVDLQSGAGEAKKRGKVSTTAALKAVQRSTASMGKFDQMREGEPERRKTLSKMKKRKLESSTDKKVIASESQKAMKILNAVMTGGGAAKEKAIRKGKLATGETAYDYEYNDGLGASTFKKKKGRAGAGKMKKMTKKRVK